MAEFGAVRNVATGTKARIKIVNRAAETDLWRAILMEILFGGEAYGYDEPEPTGRGGESGDCCKVRDSLSQVGGGVKVQELAILFPKRFARSDWKVDSGKKYVDLFADSR
jgi:hypothetical protein